MRRGSERFAPQSIRFPGQYFDAETGLHYNYHRYYDPSIGRYVSADPIGQVGGINLYTYVGNQPTNWSDPLGLIPPGWAKANLHGGRSPRPFLPDVANLAAGFGDTATFGLTSAINAATGADSVVDPDSAAFLGGQVAGYGALACAATAAAGSATAQAAAVRASAAAADAAAATATAAANAATAAVQTAVTNPVGTAAAVDFAVGAVDPNLPSTPAGEAGAGARAIFDAVTGN